MKKSTLAIGGGVGVLAWWLLTQKKTAAATATPATTTATVMASLFSGLETQGTNTAQQVWNLLVSQAATLGISLPKLQATFGPRPSSVSPYTAALMACPGITPLLQTLANDFQDFLAATEKADADLYTSTGSDAGGYNSTDAAAYEAAANQVAADLVAIEGALATQLAAVTAYNTQMLPVLQQVEAAWNTALANLSITSAMTPTPELTLAYNTGWPLIYKGLEMVLNGVPRLNTTSMGASVTTAYVEASVPAPTDNYVAFYGLTDATVSGNQSAIETVADAWATYQTDKASLATNPADDSLVATVNADLAAMNTALSALVLSFLEYVSTQWTNWWNSGIAAQGANAVADGSGPLVVNPVLSIGAGGASQIVSLGPGGSVTTLTAYFQELTGYPDPTTAINALAMKYFGITLPTT